MILRFRTRESHLMAIPLPDARELSDDDPEAIRLRGFDGCGRGYNETELAEILGVSRETICRWRSDYGVGTSEPADPASAPRRPGHLDVCVPWEMP